MPELSFDDDLDEQEAPNPVRQLREQLKAEKAAAKERQAELDELKAFREQAEKANRQAEVEKAFGELGQTPTAAKYFPSDLEPTAENVANYLKDFGIELTQEEEPDEGELAPATGFQPLTVGGTPGKRRISYEDYQKLLDSDPPAAVKAVAENRVDGFQGAPRQ